MANNNFSRTESILNRLREIIQCQLCKKLKDVPSVVFYRTCDHFFCTKCVAETSPCFICDNTEAAVKLNVDKNMLSLYHCVVNFKLPTKEHILNIVKKHETSEPIEPPAIATEKLQRKSVKVETTLAPKKPNTRDSIRQLGQKITEEDVAKSKSSPLTTPKVEKTLKQVKAKRETPQTKTVPVKVTPNTNSKSKLNVNKRNPKGETPLHLAGKKGNLSLMNDLIEAGANPNAQDNAGWTPLHDAVAKDNLPVIKFLLDNGAKPNTPGLENITPLHQAVENGNISTLKLLASFGADPHARNIYGETPLDYAKKLGNVEVEKIIISSNVKADSRLATPSRQEGKFLISGYNLNPEQKLELDKFSELSSSKVLKNILPKMPITHIVVPKGCRMKIDWNFVSSICLGSWVVSYQWIQESVKEKIVKSYENFELEDELYSGFKKARSNKENQLPGLFSGCHFFFGGNFESYRVKEMDIGKEDLKFLVEKNGGQILKRSPDPESLALERTIPYHAKVDSSVAQTSYYIIYQEDKWDPKPKYNMVHMKTLPVDWLIACIIKFDILDPKTETFSFD